jgi:nucleoside-diphosphate-sugar epimerase
MDVIVLGGTGFIGPSLVHLLHELGHDVTVVHSGAHEAELPPVRHIHAPVEQLSLDGGRTGRADVVIAMRLMTEAEAAAFVTAFRGRAPRAVVVSSADVYLSYGRLHGTEPGPPQSMPLREDAELRHSLYPYREQRPRAVAPSPWLRDYDKILVERAARVAPELSCTVLRLGMVHGPRSRRYADYVRRMEDRRRVILLTPAAMEFRSTRAYVDDVARAIALAATDPGAAGETYNVGEREPVAEGEWVRVLGAVVGWDGEAVAVPPEGVPPELGPRIGLHALPPGHHLELDTGRIREQLGYREIVPREEALRRTVEWLRAAPWEGTPPDYEAEDALLARL